MLVRRDRAALFLLAVGTAAILPGALNRFVFPKLAVILAGVILTGWCTARGSLPRLIAALVALAGVLLAIAAVLGEAPAAQLIGRPPRYEGLVALPVYAGALFAGARLLGPERPADAMPWWLDCLAAAAIVVAVEAVLESAGVGALRSDVTRPGSLLGNASDEGAWGLLVLGPLGCVAIEQRRPMAAAGAVAAIVTLVCSGSRGALVGAVVVIIVAAVGLREGRRWWLPLVAIGVLAAGAWLVPDTRERVLERTPHAAESVTGHWLLAGETASLVLARPALGVGSSGFVDAIPREHDQRWEREIGPAQPPDSPENWLLQAAAAGGLPLLAIAVALAALTLRAGRDAIRTRTRDHDRAALVGTYAALIGYAIALLFHFTSPGTTPLAALIAGTLLAGAPRPQATWRRARPIVTLGAAALLVVLMAGAIAEIPLRSALTDAGRDQAHAADENFRLARDLRPWDAGVAALATHAFAVLAATGDADAARRGQSWATRELAAWPSSVQALADTAVLDAALGERAAAIRALARARALDPRNPQLRAAGAQLTGASTR